MSVTCPPCFPRGLTRKFASSPLAYERLHLWNCGCWKALHGQRKVSHEGLFNSDEEGEIPKRQLYCSLPQSRANTARFRATIFAGLGGVITIMESPTAIVLASSVLTLALIGVIIGQPEADLASVVTRAREEMQTLLDEIQCTRHVLGAIEGQMNKGGICGNGRQLVLSATARVREMKERLQSELLSILRGKVCDPPGLTSATKTQRKETQYDGRISSVPSSWTVTRASCKY